MSGCLYAGIASTRASSFIPNRKSTTVLFKTCRHLLRLIFRYGIKTLIARLFFPCALPAYSALLQVVRPDYHGGGVEQKDLIKLACLLFLFGLAAPTLGIALKGRRLCQRAVFALMCFMTIGGFFSASDWGLTLQNVEFYRGHSRGYHFYFNEGLARLCARKPWNGAADSGRRLATGFICCPANQPFPSSPRSIRTTLYGAFKAVKMLDPAATTFARGKRPPVLSACHVGQ
jgi:hypothetical protein